MAYLNGKKIPGSVNIAMIGSSVDTDNFANAVKANVSGTSLVIDDLSPLTSKLSVSVKEKPPAYRIMMSSAAPAAAGEGLVNLIPFTRDDGKLGYKDAAVDETKTQSDIEYRVNDNGSISVKGFASGFSQFTLYQSYESLAPFAVGKCYTKNAVPEGVSFGFSIYGSDKNESAVNGTVAVWAKGCVIRLTVAKDTDLTNGVTVYPMIVEGPDVTITEYVPPQGENGGGHDCVDNNNDHLCDICGEKISDCVDENPKDCYCDICGAEMSEHEDADSDHFCDYCSVTMGSHADINGDGLCDYCNQPASHPHEDANLDHLCDYCGKKISECVDNNKDNICDVCGKPMEGATGNELVNLIPFTRDDGKLGYKDAAVGENKTEYGATYHVNDNGSITITTDGATTGYSAFVLYDNPDSYAPFEIGSYYGRYLQADNVVRLMYRNYTSSGNHITFIGSSATFNKLISDTTDITGLYFYVEVPSGTDLGSDGKTVYPMIAEVPDVSYKIQSYVPPQGENGGGHDCVDNNNDHLCDICGEKISDCVDNDKDHLCDICGAEMSEHEDADSDHFCDYCSVTMGSHADINGDGLCDYCNQPASHPHEDANLDHLCDYCGKKISECVDNNKDGYCDICKTLMHVCADNNKDHLCDICGKKISECVDDDKDGFCDICGTFMHTCIDANNDHLCDVCSKRLSECVDYDKDHYCDICGKNVYETEPDDNHDHLCDYCGATISNCIDADNNHICEICGTILGEHADRNGDGLCDYCKQPIGNAGLIVTITTASATDPSVVGETVVTTIGSTVELTPIFPSMVITADSDLVILSMEYNRDTNKVVDKLQQEIDSKSKVTIVSSTGNSTTSVMSQKAVTTAIDNAKSYTDTKISEVTPTSLGVYTREEVDDKIGSGDSVDPSNYYSKQEIDAMIGDIDTALEELHTYAQNLANGGSTE